MSIKIDTKFEQVFYNLYGYSKIAWGSKIVEDNIPGPITQKVREQFQAERKKIDSNIVVDGIRGKQTEGEIIKVIQHDFNIKGISKLALNGSNLAEDGKFGDVSTKVTVKLQDIKGLLKDGIMYIVTLNALVSYNSTTSTTPTNTTNDGSVFISYTEDRQDTAYTCGPSSLKMALSHYGLNVDEIWIGRKAGTTSTAGTSVENMVNVIKVINSTYGTSFKARSEGFSSWETLKGYLSKGYPVILRVQSWIHPNGGEHYVLLYGLDIASGKAYLGDPSYGKRTVTLADLRERIRKVSSASIIVISK